MYYSCTENKCADQLRGSHMQRVGVVTTRLEASNKDINLRNKTSKINQEASEIPNADYVSQA